MHALLTLIRWSPAGDDAKERWVLTNVCFEGQHTIAGALAALALLSYNVVLPIIAFRWLWKNPALAAELAACRTQLIRH